MIYCKLPDRPQNKLAHYTTIAVIAISTAIVILMTSFVFFNGARVAEKIANIEKYERVQRLLNDTLINLLNAETGQRGFLLTGKSMYLAPYLTGKADVKNDLKHLKILLSKKYAKDYRTIKLLSAKKFDELKTTISLRKQNKFNSALALVKTNKGIKDMNKLRSYISVLKSSYKKRAETAHSWVLKKSDYIKIALPGVILGYLLILLFVYVLLYLNSKKITKYEENLRHAAVDLESSYENEKTAKLFYLAISQINNLIPKSLNYAEFFTDVAGLFSNDIGIDGICVFKDDKPYAKLIASAGVKNINEFTEGLKVSADENIPEGRGIYGKALRGAEVIYSNDFITDNASAPWQQKLKKLNFLSLAAMPIKTNDEPFGALVICSSQKDYFDREKVKFLKEISSILSYAVDYLENRNNLIQERDLSNILIENIHSGIAIYDENKFLYVNSTLLHLFHYTKEKFLNLNVTDFFSINEDQLYYKNSSIFKMYHNSEISSRFIYKYDYISSDNGNNEKDNSNNKVRYIDLFRTAITYNGKQTGLAIFSDVTDQILREQNILVERETYKELAEIDALTGVGNRRSFDSKLTEMLNTANRYNRPLSLIMFDIDKFKDINDTYGHEIGDFILKELSHLIKQNLRTTDFFARYGGEEFMIIAAETSLPTAKELAERLRIKAAEYDFNIGQYVTCSFGITEIIKGDTNQSIVFRVDNALYDAKRSGRNKVCFE
jgi:diguanylate cyclase (GGDEF)-like protein